MAAFDPNNQTTWPPVLSAAQVAEIYRDSTATIYDLAAAGELPCLPRKPGQKIRVPRDQFIECLGVKAPKLNEPEALRLMAAIRERGTLAQAAFVTAWRGMADGKHPMGKVIENQFEMIAAALDHALVERVAAEVLKSI